jgi:hypothetical protein
MNTKLKIKSICSAEAYTKLQNWIIERNPNFPYPMKPEQYFYNNTKHREYLSKFIESVIVLMLRSKGADPVKGADKGKAVDKSETITNILGQQRTFKKTIYIKDKSVRAGRADVTCFYKGKMYNFEVKVGSDTQSEDQKKEQRRAEENGEAYIIIKNIDDFLKIY